MTDKIEPMTEERLIQLRHVSYDGTSYTWSNSDMQQAVVEILRLRAVLAERDATIAELETEASQFEVGILGIKYEMADIQAEREQLMEKCVALESELAPYRKGKRVTMWQWRYDEWTTVHPMDRHYFSMTPNTFLMLEPIASHVQPDPAKPLPCKLSLCACGSTSICEYCLAIARGTASRNAPDAKAETPITKEPKMCNDIHSAAATTWMKEQAQSYAKAESSNPETRQTVEVDNCQICKGARGGVKGNENVIKGITVCDYCSVTIQHFRKLTGELVNAGDNVFVERDSVEVETPYVDKLPVEVRSAVEELRNGYATETTHLVFVALDAAYPPRPFKPKPAADTPEVIAMELAKVISANFEYRHGKAVCQIFDLVKAFDAAMKAREGKV